MNQILQTENKKQDGSIDIKKIVIFFAIAIIIFGIVLICLGSYAMITGTKKPEQSQNNPQIENTVPEVNIERTEDNILINIKHTKPIASVTYHWNEETEQTIETNNNMEISEEIALPYGNNTLNVTVTDSDGKESNYVKEYISDGDGKPVIELLLTKENKIRIKVQDMQGLKYIRYTWNSGNYTTVKANIDNLKIIDELVEIPLGQNTLRVEAVNVDSMITTKELEVKGVRRPVVSLKLQDKDLVIKAEDQSGLKVINITINGQKYQMNCMEKKLIQHKMPLEQGENIVELTAENIEGGITEVNGKCVVE